MSTVREYTTSCVLDQKDELATHGIIPCYSYLRKNMLISCHQNVKKISGDDDKTFILSRVYAKCFVLIIYL